MLGKVDGVSGDVLVMLDAILSKVVIVPSKMSSVPVLRDVHLSGLVFLNFESKQCIHKNNLHSKY